MIAPTVEMIPAWLYFAGPAVTALVGALSATVIMHYRKVQSGQLVPKATVDDMREQYAAQLAALITVSDGQLAHFAAVLASKDRDIDQWRGAWQITDQAGREEVAGQLEELVAFARVFRRWMDEFQRQTGVPELAPDRGAHDG